jgi:hypothetical protein
VGPLPTGEAFLSPRDHPHVRKLHEHARRVVFQADQTGNHLPNLVRRQHTLRLCRRARCLRRQPVEAFHRRRAVLELHERTRLNLGGTHLSKIVNELATGQGILEQPVPDLVDAGQCVARWIAQLDGKVALERDSIAARPQHAHHLANDPNRIGHVNQQIPAEHDVERRIRECELRRIAPLEPHARRVVGPRVRVLDQVGVVLQADARSRLENVGETPGRVALSAAEIQTSRVRQLRQPRKDLPGGRVQNRGQKLLPFGVALIDRVAHQHGF